MNQNTQIALVERALEHARQRTTDCAAHGHARPVADYLSERRYAAELEGLFRRGPLLFGHGSEIPEPGDFITREIAGLPLLVVRQDDGSIAGFANVCRHRGTCVVDAARGRGRKSFVCPYHGWTYRRDGLLAKIPDGYGFPEIAAGRDGLRSIPVAEVSGFIATAPLALPPEIAADLDGFGLASHHVYAPVRLDQPMSWKLALDIFLESYHLRVAHRKTIYPMFFDNLGLVDHFDPHLRNVFPKRSIRGLAETAPETWELRAHANILYFIFPSTIILIEPDHAAVLHVLPVAVDRCVVEAYTLIPEPADERAARYWDRNNEILYGAIAEDFALGASIQRGLASGANRALRFGRFEHALTYFHQAVDRAIAESETGAPEGAPVQF